MEFLDKMDKDCTAIGVALINETPPSMPPLYEDNEQYTQAQRQCHNIMTVIRKVRKDDDGVIPQTGRDALQEQFEILLKMHPVFPTVVEMFRFADVKME